MCPCAPFHHTTPQIWTSECPWAGAASAVLVPLRLLTAVSTAIGFTPLVPELKQSRSRKQLFAMPDVPDRPTSWD